MSESIDRTGLSHRGLVNKLSCPINYRGQANQKHLISQELTELIQTIVAAYTNCCLLLNISADLLFTFAGGLSRLFMVSILVSTDGSAFCVSEQCLAVE